jgi:hypothetical protein
MNEHFLYRLGSPDRSLGRPPQFYRSSDLVARGCRFASVYAIRKEDAEAINEAGTAAQFKGIVWGAKLWIDLDTEEAARAAQCRLKELGLGHTVWTTGGRGCHIGVDRLANPSHLLPYQDKQWVKENIAAADLSLYWHLHLIRLPGALHEKTGQPKRLLYTIEGRHLSLPQYNPEQTDVAVEGQKSPKDGYNSIFSNWSIVSKLTDDGTSRHHQLVRLASALVDHGGVSQTEALWVLLEVNRGFKEPKPVEEVEKIVGWAYNG